MCGFIFGTICLVALAKVLRRGCGFRRGCGGGGCGGGGCGGGGFHGYGHWQGFGPGGPGPGGEGPGFGGGRFADFVLRRVSAELDATPAQEKVLREVLDGLRDSMGKNREVLRAARADVAKTLRTENFSEESLADVIARHDEVHDRMRKSLVDALAKLHTTLDAGQREKLANLIANGPFFGRF
ncbi:MAG TPA: periplasmic heavy metal sensor [Pseudomonadota bacterium]|jgi:hypothetical protein|nr:periplasmic heavy metal sensor [Pseudomonadota bacterium]HNI58391.1 periplasmic heavy metal sensor [Pseudomonadota bacterium]HNK43764.1 periplasmic heavy metal sensor [Pseudomonadota bacterium]HNN49476.1 periplasmic heavy metal sensor [Pseudomonadota bacterium]HNO69388.1 periplasmic heavy metal sensor [Pseudomonadota bacterium]